VGRLRADAVLLLFAAALVLRLLVVFLEPPTRPLGDEPAWLAVADSVEAAGFDPLRADLIFYPPVYPYLIAATRHLFGVSGSSHSAETFGHERVGLPDLHIGELHGVEEVDGFSELFLLH